jgi:cobalt-zinc-cadmium efflux system protein
MSHSHHSRQDDGDAGSRRLLVVLALNLSITLAQIVGGLLAGSLSLLADAVHNGSDAASLLVSYIARRISRREADPKRTFGYNRAEIIGALINLTTLILIGFYLLGQAINRFFNPQPVEGMVMLVVGGIALVEDAISAYLLYKDAKGSLNIRSAMLHMIGDTLATVGVLVGSVFIILFNIYIVDPIITVLIAVYILAHSYLEIRKAIGILMESAPEGFDFAQMVHDVEAIEGVKSLHHVHLWRLDEARVALEAHVVVVTQSLGEVQQIKQTIREKLTEAYGIEHATLETEVEGRVDHDEKLIQNE